jgi:hypothetical protein
MEIEDVAEWIQLADDDLYSAQMKYGNSGFTKKGGAL